MSLYKYEVVLSFEGETERVFETAESPVAAKKMAVSNADGWPVAKDARVMYPVQGTSKEAENA